MAFDSNVVLLLFSFLCVNEGYCSTSERLTDKMYQPIAMPISYACFLKLNGTHEVGCTSSRSGNVGVIHEAAVKEDIYWALETGAAPPYMVVLAPYLFNRENLLLMKNSDRIAGIALIDVAREKMHNYSHERECPNRESSMYYYKGDDELVSYCDKQPWNPSGTGLLYEDWGFPIFFLDDNKDVGNIRKCFAKFNRDVLSSEGDNRALCAMELVSYMLAAVDTPTCMRRSNMITNFNPVVVCDPMGDKNIMSTLLTYNETKVSTGSRSVLVLSTRMDTVTMFDSYVPGADSPITALVGLLTVANLLRDIQDDMDASSNFANVLFVIFNGETYDYIGSSRMVYDMIQGTYPPIISHIDEDKLPFKLDQIGLFLELNQISFNGGDDTLYIHTDPLTTEPTAREQINKVISLLQQEGKNYNMSFNQTGDSFMPLPPASLQSFLRFDNEIPGIVITDHRQEYTNRFYHSILDDKYNLNYTYMNGSTDNPGLIQTQITRLAASVASVVYKLISDNKERTFTPNVTLIDELLHCYLETADCKLFHAITKSAVSFQKEPFPLYVGVLTQDNAITTLTHNVLAYLTGKVINLTEAECHGHDGDLHRYLWMVGEVANTSGICIQSNINTSLAVSPAFIIDDYDYKSGNYSSWTESRWQKFTGRIFLKPSRQQEIAVLSIGTTVLVLSFLLVYFINSRASIIFHYQITATVC